MAGILSGLKNLGLNKMDGMKIYEDEDKKEKTVAEPVIVKKAPTVNEKDLIYDKALTCPVCDNKFTSKVMKTGKCRLLSMDLDLRMRYEGIDSVKYDVQVCPECGYAAIASYFPTILSSQAKLIKENISSQVKMHISNGETYSYEEAIERYQLALACAIVKHAKDSEKAYICLRFAWLLRGYAEDLKEKGELSPEKEAELKSQEQECIQNAYDGFVNARQRENLPICGMDSITLDYLIAALAYETNRDDVAAKMLAGILVSNTASSRIKDKARDLKNLILERHKKESK